MTHLGWLAVAFALGSALGTAYFVALWATVRTLPTARNPAIIVFGSYIIRIGLAAAAFVLIVRAGGLPWIASALGGFVFARMVIVRRVLPSNAMPSRDT